MKKVEKCIDKVMGWCYYNHNKRKNNQSTKDIHSIHSIYRWYMKNEKDEKERIG